MSFNFVLFTVISIEQDVCNLSSKCWRNSEQIAFIYVRTQIKKNTWWLATSWSPVAMSSVIQVGRWRIFQWQCSIGVYRAVTKELVTKLGTNFYTDMQKEKDMATKCHHILVIFWEFSELDDHDIWCFQSIIDRWLVYQGRHFFSLGRIGFGYDLVNSGLLIMLIKMYLCFVVASDQIFIQQLLCSVPRCLQGNVSFLSIVRPKWCIIGRLQYFLIH